MIDDVVPVLLDLLALNSDLEADKAPVVDYVARRLSEAGMNVSIVGPEDDPALVASFGQGGIMFSGHLDTVPVGNGWTRKQGEIFENRVYGRGTVDMKGACAAMIAIAPELVKENVPFSICLTTDEEESMLGARAASELPVAREAKAIIIAEPTSLYPAYREKGVFRFNLTTKGRASHASQPWLGDNAIMKMHQCLARLNDLTISSSERTTGMTACVSTIEGGTKSNVVPDRCRTEIDIRFPLPQTSRDVDSIITNRLMGLDYEMEVDHTLEAFEADPSSPLVTEMASFLGTEPTVVPYATEAPKFAEYNRNVSICGPGDPRLAHTVDEFVEIVELQEAYLLFQHMAFFVQG